MEKFISHTGIGVPLRRSNVDTDQIIPAVFLKRVTKTGFDDALFYAWRREPDFILNREPYSQGSVLVAGPDFGTVHRASMRCGHFVTTDLRSSSLPSSPISSAETRASKASLLGSSARMTVKRSGNCSKLIPAHKSRFSGR